MGVPDTLQQGVRGHAAEKRTCTSMGADAVASPRRCRRGKRSALVALVLQRLELFIEPSNEPSWRAAERAHYRREGLLRSRQAIDDTRRDMYAYSRLPDH